MVLQKQPLLLVLLLFFLQGLPCLHLHAEPVVKTETIHFSESPAIATMSMQGTLDGANTYKHSYNIDVEQAFEPMRSITLSNTGTTTIHSPRLIINKKRGIYDFASLKNRVLADAVTDKETALSLWLYFRDHRVHHRSPESWCNITDPIKLLGIYGYFTCGSAANLLSAIGKHLGYSADTIHLNDGSNTHAVPEINFGDGSVILDIDTQVFYLDYDNKTLLGAQDITNDNFLIRRTHHFGKNRNNNFDIAPLYNGEIKRSDAGTCIGHSLDIDLRPGESFTYDWSPPALFHHLMPVVPQSIPWMVTNSRFDYRPAFATAPLSELVYAVENIQVATNGTGSVHPTVAQQSAYLTLAVFCPYTILDGTVSIISSQNSPADTMTCEFSKDGITWFPLWNGVQTGQDSISLISLIAPMSEPALHTYYIRVSMYSHAEPTDCSLDFIGVTTICQASKYNMPQLQLGANSLAYSDKSGAREIDIVVNWQESSDNTPPEKLVAPIFPIDTGFCENSRFTFRWPNAEDADGDVIVDYEFQLSDRPDMRFPLSPTFDRYIHLLHDPLKPEFTIPFAGLLNDGEPYYWRVRARDARGAWGEWSDIWAFTVNTVMMPMQPYALGNDGNLALNWRSNDTGKTPAYFQIHASNIENGFTPEANTLVAEMAGHSFSLSGLDYTFYRVIAVDENGQASGPSRLVTVIPTGVRETEETPTDFTLSQNSPNPFNAVTSIHYALATDSHVVLTVYNALGRHIETLVDAAQTAGSHRILFHADSMPSGVFYYTLQNGHRRQIKRMTLIR